MFIRFSWISQCFTEKLRTQKRCAFGFSKFHLRSGFSEKRQEMSKNRKNVKKKLPNCQKMLRNFVKFLEIRDTNWDANVGQWAGNGVRMCYIAKMTAKKARRRRNEEKRQVLMFLQGFYDRSSFVRAQMDQRGEQSLKIKKKKIFFQKFSKNFFATKKKFEKNAQFSRPTFWRKNCFFFRKHFAEQISPKTGKS